MNVERQEVHSLVDQLAISQLAAVHSLLEVMLDPVARAVANAGIDDEPESAEERQAVAEATEWLKHNKPIPFEDALADFGLTLQDLEGQDLKNEGVKIPRNRSKEGGTKKIGFSEQARADVRELDIPTAMRISRPCSGLQKPAPGM